MTQSSGESDSQSEEEPWISIPIVIAAVNKVVVVSRFMLDLVVVYRLSPVIICWRQSGFAFCPVIHLETSSAFSLYLREVLIRVILSVGVIQSPFLPAVCYLRW